MKKKIKRRSSRYNTKETDILKLRTSRLFFLGILLLLGFGVILIKLFKVQILENHYWLDEKNDISLREKEIPAKRGSIWDRNGKTLVEDQVNYSMAVHIERVRNKITTARKISQLTGIPYLEVVTKIKKKKGVVYIAHRLTPTTVEKLEALKLDGLAFEKRYSGYYGFGKNAAHLLGFCDYDNNAKYGLELAYNDYLAGTPGQGVFIRDNKGWWIPDFNYPRLTPINGSNIITTIDITFQPILEDELKKTVTSHDAKKGMAILLNVNTGEILSMANYPEFNPNRFNESPIQNYRNYAISDQYEPGSTFKIIALTYIIEQLRMNLDSNKVFCENGKYRIFRNVIHDHKKYGDLTIREVFGYSSNVGIVKLSKQFEPNQFYRYARDFGFGTYTGIDLPSETKGVLYKPSEYSATSIPYMSIGYEVAVTPLQIALAYAAIANGGKLMQPYVVSKIINSKNGIVKENKPKVIRRVIQPRTAAEINKTLVGVVENGTGRNARIEGVLIAGKTGTARKIEDGIYVSKYISSFVGFFPAESPQFVLLVLIDEPKEPKGRFYGSQVAAPAFKNIAKRIIGLPVDYERQQFEEATIAEFGPGPIFKNKGRVIKNTSIEQAEMEDDSIFFNENVNIKSSGNLIQEAYLRTSANQKTLEFHFGQKMPWLSIKLQNQEPK
jgi:cell division protein FtsI (penicillin-binding protein 3)